MRPRKKIENLSDIKEDPDVRIVFGQSLYKEFLSLLKISKEFNFNITNMARHILLIFVYKMECSEKEERTKMILQIIQSMHGMAQTSILDKAEAWENITVAPPPAGGKKTQPKKKKKGNAK